MYNLTVDEAHTFYVGDGQWLVHSHCGLTNASQGLKSLFSKGSVRGSRISDIRSALLKDGFTEGVTNNQKGILLRNNLGEEVRIMNRGAGWDIRMRNRFGNYLDEFGHVAGLNLTNLIEVYP